MRASSRESPARVGFVGSIEPVQEREPVALGLGGQASLPRAETGRRSGFLAPGRTMVPWCAAGKKPALQFAGPLGANPRESGSTTNVGRFWLRLPRP